MVLVIHSILHSIIKIIIFIANILMKMYKLDKNIPYYNLLMIIISSGISILYAHYYDKYYLKIFYMFFLSIGLTIYFLEAYSFIGL